jgi:molecular chaperone DnaJ
VLGVRPEASDGEIKAAFRKLAKQYHPDLHAGDKRAEARFKEVNEAHAILSDPGARAQYDASLLQRRSLRWRSLRGAAAIMAASFVLTVTAIATAIL